MTPDEDREKHLDIDTVPMKVVPLAQARRLQIARDLIEGDRPLAELPAEDGTE